MPPVLGIFKIVNLMIRIQPRLQTREADALQVHPVFCLMKSSLMESLVRFTAGGQRKIDRWTALHRCVEVVFDDRAAFVNANTPAELQQLQAHD